eukprot:CAMPEP_0203682834 /NCGR_PEP_ID=MMETSP0090-20130426/47203_1 /ASSEMBLY_ACC=CAM_ASM_001088 /TAXON_ID=426623 /ORGANISM="Chaetoceros affinis, Strain CCMP159" /LENGTH=845 /DNA_ID=CAMNT_0050551951 /DNA_START=88 /DNA_END=2622 /DNA_ORIENTATION=+
MTGVADLYLYLKKPYSKDRRKRLAAHFYKPDSHTRFVVLSWKRTGSNLLCGMLHLHPEITMHNELFNPIDIFTYHPSFKNIERNKPLWTVLTRDLFPMDFLDFVWSGMNADHVTPIKPKFKALGFKSFPEHWIDVRNEQFPQENLVEDLRVKKIVLRREDELAVFVSMKRADQTGYYMTQSYPKDLTIHVDPAEFQRFLNNYRNTFRNKYRSPIEKRDTFHITYEQLVDENEFERNIAPKLWDFLGVRNDVPVRKLRETIKQAEEGEELSKVISNYDELEFCFRHSDVLHFQQRQKNLQLSTSSSLGDSWQEEMKIPQDDDCGIASWSLLVPICSRPKVSQAPPPHDVSKSNKDLFNSNRFIDVAISSQHDPNNMDKDNIERCWAMLEDFAQSLLETSTREQLCQTECIVGIDVDDVLYTKDEAKERIQKLLPCKVIFVNIFPQQYGQVCRIWNALGRKASNDYIVLLGDDIKLLDKDWQQRIVWRFKELSESLGLPLGAACVAMNDLSFPGFPTFPVVHRWHIEHFGNILPKQFANQGGDPFLYELYSRYNSASFEVSCRLENTIGGDGDARYQKHQINWRGQILSMNLRFLKSHLDGRLPDGICIDVVIPCYRVDNEDYLRRILLLRATAQLYVKFWVVIDNPLKRHIDSVHRLADEINKSSQARDCNYFVNVIHYSENRGASYARNTGFNYTTADWVLFLDDDVIPDSNILDAYAGAIKRYPAAKVFVGMTELPHACTLWTEMLRACNVGYFYGIAKQMVHPSWGVTANLMVRGSRHNPRIQFKNIYPKTGGGEDIDFVYQFKEWYQSSGRLVTVGVPEAKVQHPWWNKGNSCYKQIMGWAW